MATFETRPAGTVEAMMLPATAEGNETVREWVRGLSEDFTVTPPNAMTWSNIVATTPDGNVVAYGNQYIYWDGTTLRVADKQVFEMYYMPSV